MNSVKSIREKLAGNSITEIPAKTFSHIYKFYVRDHLPYTQVVTLNGVEVKRDRPFDRYAYYVNSGDNPGYEADLVSFIRSYAEEGDTAVVVGGGWGVSTVVAAKQVGENGRVHAYEAGESQAEVVSETVARNEVEDRCEVHHAAVGPTVGAYSDVKGADRISGDDLPAADILIIDCEGAEFEVLETLSKVPERIIVEHHAVMDSSGNVAVRYQPEKVEKYLSDIEFEIVEYTEEDHKVEANAHWVAKTGTK